MKKLVILLIIPLFSCGQMDIVGGQDADISDYPWQVALLESSGELTFAFCGGSIIDNFWILTAAHCVEDGFNENLYIRAGSDNYYAQGGMSYSVDEVIIHPNYNNNTMNNDIALLKLTNPIYFNNNKQSVMLMCDNQVSIGAQSVGTISTITGWGETETNNYNGTLQVASVPITNSSNYSLSQIDPDMIMAGYSNGGSDSCQGDSGGPMVVRDINNTEWMQVGIVSWGYDCAEVGYPGVYTRVSYFLDWICTNTNGDVCANEYEFCNPTIYGCTYNLACNYNAGATENNGTCIYPIQYYDCELICLNDMDGDGICNELEIAGCTDPLACNYNSSATNEDGACAYPELGLDCEGSCIDINIDVQICTCAENETITSWSEYNSSLCTIFYLCTCECLNDQNNNDICDEYELGVWSQDVQLNSGWNLWSTYIQPVDNSLESVFSSIINDVVIIKNKNGEVYWPQYNLNSIGSLNDGEGYQAKMENNNTLLLEGDLIPYNFELNIENGWNIIGYLHQYLMNVEEAMSPIVESIIIVKDEDGFVYWPQFGLNSIGYMLPGKGYQVKTENDVTFVYQALESGRLGFNTSEPFVSLKYQKPINTGDNMTIAIPDAVWLESPSIGDEIAVFDANGLIVGNDIYREEGTVITVWGDDDISKDKDGLFSGELLNFKLFRTSESIVEDIVIESWIEGNGTYSTNGISIAGVVSQSVNTPKQLVKVTDVIGRDIKDNSEKSVLLYIYDDGSVERRYILK
jgi:trypsin